MSDGQLAVTVLVLVVVALLVQPPVKRRFFTHAVALEHHGTLFLRDGVVTRELRPGRHRINPKRERVVSISTRPSALGLRGHEVLSADGLTLKVSLDIELHVVDVRLAYASGGGPATADYLVQSHDSPTLLRARAADAVRSTVAGHELEQLLAMRDEVGAAVLTAIADRAMQLGLHVDAVLVRDFQLPAPVKRLLGATVQARMEGLAALEQARAEHATMRSLANTARLISDHPELARLRMIQEMSNSQSPTFVIGVDPGSPLART